jgi:hypothetical protein
MTLVTVINLASYLSPLLFIVSIIVTLIVVANS